MPTAAVTHIRRSVSTPRVALILVSGAVPISSRPSMAWHPPRSDVVLSVRNRVLPDTNGPTDTLNRTHRRK